MPTRLKTLVLGLSFVLSTAAFVLQVRPGAFSTLVTTHTGAGSICSGANNIGAPSACAGGISGGALEGASLALSGGIALGTTIDTGFGATEVYPMDQAVRTTDSPSLTALSVKSGTSTGFSGKVGGVIRAVVSGTGNVGGGEDTLFSEAIAANTLAANGAALVIEIFGTCVSSGDSKTIRVKFGATTVATIGAFTTDCGDWRTFVIIQRTGATTQSAVVQAGVLTTQLVAFTAPGETLSGAVTLAVTGEGVVTNDIILRGLIAWAYPAS